MTAGKPVFRIFWLIIAAFSLLPHLSAGLLGNEDVGECPALKAARSTMEAMKPFGADFIQQVYYGEELTVEEKGTLVFATPRLIRWTYLDPEHKVFLLNGEGYQFYEPEAGQLTRGSLKGRRGGWIWQLLVSNDTQIVEDCPPAGGKMVLKDPADGTRFRILLDKRNRIVRVEHRDSGGARHVYLLSKFRERIKPDADEFRLQVENGTEVVDMDAESS